MESGDSFFFFFREVQLHLCLLAPSLYVRETAGLHMVNDLVISRRAVEKQALTEITRHFFVMCLKCSPQTATSGEIGKARTLCAASHLSSPVCASFEAVASACARSQVVERLFLPLRPAVGVLVADRSS